VSRDPVYKEIGALIRVRRKTLKRKQEALASELGISRGALANIETGRQGILVHQLYRFASALKLTITDLLPSPSVDKHKVERTDLPLPSDLKPQQKEQVARLILQGDPRQNDSTQLKHAKPKKR
jgi:transcriptional regulator with XRE-family HTH domain